MSRLRFPIVTMAAALAALTGCQLETGTGESGASELESIIERQLPGQLGNFGQDGWVRNVSCVETGEGNRFDCVAKVDFLGFTPSGRGGTRSIPITGYCDDRSCTWKTGR